jgi:ribosome-binding protein aMBF1 (putative translation factor)
MFEKWKKDTQADIEDYFEMCFEAGKKEALSLKEQENNKTLEEIKAGIEELDLKRIIDDWYYNEINQAVTIGDISRIELAKKIKEELQKIIKEMGQ